MLELNSKVNYDYLQLKMKVRVVIIILVIVINQGLTALFMVVIINLSLFEKCSINYVKTFLLIKFELRVVI